MEEKKVVYYLIHDEVLAKRYSGWDGGDYILRDGKWVYDSEDVVENYLAGYEPSKPETGVPTEIKEISWEQAIPMINQQILDTLKNKWKVEFAAKKEEWDKNPGWPAKYVKTTYTLNGLEYNLYPGAIGLTGDGWDQGFMESVQSDIKKDLELYGATEVRNFGCID